jgi:hypothetical protein
VGIGAIAGAMGAGLIAGRVPLGRLFWLGLCAAGTGLTGLAFSTALPVAIAVCLLVGRGTGVLNVIFALAGLLVVAGGLTSIAPLQPPDVPAAERITGTLA